MIKNVVLKRVLKNTLFRAVSLVNKLIAKDKNKVLFYSANGGIGDNLLPLKNYLIDNEYWKKYKIICCVENEEYIKENESHIHYITRLNAIQTFLTSKYVFYSTGQIPVKPSRQQIVWFVDHGVAFKKYGPMGAKINGYNHYFTKFVVPSDVYIPIIKEDFLCSDDDIEVIGEPMTDMLYADTNRYN
nr:CDP-glycerol glycerophosphotransferase family protein [Eubacterium sp.]